MTTSHHVYLIGGEDDEMAVFTEDGVEGKCSLVCFFRGRTIKAEAHDYFDALQMIRLEMEKEHAIPFCYGASLNVFPSGMAREMSKGKAGYRLQLGIAAQKKDLVKIFDQGVDVIPARVELQNQYFQDWLESLAGRVQ